MSARGLPKPTDSLLKVLRLVEDSGGKMHMTDVVKALEPEFETRQVQRIVYRGRVASLPVLTHVKDGGNTYHHETISITEAGRRMLAQSVTKSHN